MKKIQMYSDGSSKKNPGPGGYGTVIYMMNDKGDTIESKKELTRGYNMTTNNRMELMGIISGLEYLKTKQEPFEILITTDSKYIVNAFIEKWIEKWVENDWKTSTKQPVKNKDLWDRLLLLVKPHKITFTWVKGHNGHPENERCDYLASSSATGILFQEKDDGTVTPVPTE